MKLQKHPPNSLTLCLIQWKIQEKRKDLHFQKLLKLCQKIPKDSLVFLPEMWLGGFELSNRETHLRESIGYEEKLLEIAQKMEVDFLGSALEKNKGKFYNTIKCYSKEGKIKSLYRKMNLFKPLGEHLRFNPGRRASLLNWKGKKIGLGICFDLRFPGFWQSYIKKGAQILFVPSAWPKQRLDHYLSLLKARAIENQCFVIGVNRLGKTSSGIEYSGHSCIYGPWGEMLIQMKSQEGFRVCSIDLNQVREVRKKIPMLF